MGNNQHELEKRKLCNLKKLKNTAVVRDKQGSKTSI